MRCERLVEIAREEKKSMVFYVRTWKEIRWLLIQTVRTEREASGVEFSGDDGTGVLVELANSEMMEISRTR